MLRTTNTCSVLLRCILPSTIKHQVNNYSVQYGQRQGKMLAKLLDKSKPKKKKKEWFENVAVKSSTSSVFVKHNQTKGENRRAVVLNAMFMKYITDLLANSYVGDKIVGCGIEVSRVQICQNYHHLNIFWCSANDKENDEELENRLIKIAGPLQHELSQLRLMGEVPRVQFVKDKHISALKLIDQILAKADYGENYATHSYGRRARSEFESDEIANDSSGDILPMKNDIFGLDHSVIMGRIKSSLEKSREAWERFQKDESEVKLRTELPGNESIEDLRLANKKNMNMENLLNEFLTKRKIQRKIKLKNEFNLKDYDEGEQYEGEYYEEWKDDREFDDE